MGTRSADPLNAAVRRENVDSTWGEPGIDGANNKVSSYILTPDRATLYITPFSYSILVLHLSILVLLSFFSQPALGISSFE